MHIIIHINKTKMKSVGKLIFDFYFKDYIIPNCIELVRVFLYNINKKYLFQKLIYYIHKCNWNV